MGNRSKALGTTLLALAGTLALGACGQTAPQATDTRVSAQAMFGTPDTIHDNVALLVAFAEDGRALWRCTGTLVDPDTVLTAGHCVASDPDAVIDYVRVYFEDELERGDLYVIRDGFAYDKGTLGYVGEGIPHPDYANFAGFPNTHDIGVVELENDVQGIDPAAIAPEGYLDTLATRRGRQDVTFTISGFGLQGVKPIYMADLTRYMADVQLINLRSALTGGFNLQVTSNPGQGTGPGGLCFGDSGGAVFHGSDELIVAVNSFVLNSQCMGSGFAYRADTDDTRDFLAEYVAGITAD